MKVTLKPGAELDLLNRDELATLLDEKASGWSRPAITPRDIAAIKLDANGNSGTPGAVDPAAQPIYTVEQGMSFDLHILSIRCEGYTLGSPYTSSTGYLELRRNGRYIDGIPFTGAGLPRTFYAGTADSPTFTNGDKLEIYVVGGPANGVLTFDIQGTLQPQVIT